MRRGQCKGLQVVLFGSKDIRNESLEMGKIRSNEST